MAVTNEKHFLTGDSYRFFRRLPRIVFLLFVSLHPFVIGCTSLGHEGRAQPQIERQLSERPNEVAVTGSGELAIAVELMLVSHGINVHASPIQLIQDESSKKYDTKTITRYIVNVASTDLDVCIPEGSRQMHFNISVVDLVNNQRIFGMSGDYGCKDTILKRFERWFFS